MPRDPAIPFTFPSTLTMPLFGSRTAPDSVRLPDVQGELKALNTNRAAHADPPGLIGLLGGYRPGREGKEEVGVGGHAGALGAPVRQGVVHHESAASRPGHSYAD
jgi:hypothetical protein